MNNRKKIIAKISSIAILSTSLLSFIPLNVDAYYNKNEKIITNGSQVIRVYGSTSSSNSTPNNNNSTKNNTINDTNSNSTNNVNSSYSLNSYSNNNEKIVIKGNTITRVYGSTSSSNYTPDNNYSTENNSIPNNNNDIVNNDIVTDKKASSSANSEKLTSTSTSKTLEKTQIEKLVYEMLNLINDERKNNGLEALILDESLTSVAQMKAEDMVENDYLSHNSQNYGSIYSMIRNAGISYYNAGENIAKNYGIESAHNNFMNSYMHRNAILASHFTHVGIGIDKPARGMYKISVMFIEKK